MKKHGINSIAGIENEIYFQQKGINVVHGCRKEGGKVVEYIKFYSFRSTHGEHLSVGPNEFKQDQIFRWPYKYRKVQKECPPESERFGGQKYWIYERMNRDQTDKNFNAENFINPFEEKTE